MNKRDVESIIQKLYQANDIADDPTFSAFLNQPNGHDPTSIAIYFDRLVRAVFKHFLGYNSKTGKYGKSILGTVTGHYGVVEEQQVHLKLTYREKHYIYIF